MKVSQVKAYLLENWFKVSLVILLLLAFMQKDFSLSFNLQQPNDTTEPQIQPQELRAKKDKTPKITKAMKKAQLQNSNSSLFDNFSLPFWGKNTTEKTSKWKDVAVPKRQAFIKRFVHVARNEQEKYSVPASVVLGNAILQSGAGKKQVVEKGNNYFGLPCSADWAGPQQLTETGCYRAYENAWFSFRDHSEFLSQGDFGQLRQFGTDYKAWAKGLEKLGYPYEGNLTKDLVEVIETHNLHRYDF